MSHATECYRKLKELRELTNLPCRAVLNPGCISKIHVEIGEGVVYVNDTFAIIYGTPK